MPSIRDTEPQLELRDIQGDILVGLQKDFEWFVFFEISDAGKFKTFVKSSLLSQITHTAKVLERELAIAAHKKVGSGGKLDLIGVNVGFTQPGLAKLNLPNLNTVADAAFSQGLAARSPGLNDPTKGPNSAAQWKVGGPRNTPDGVLLITGPSQASADAARKQLVDLAATGGWKVVFEERGMTRQLDRGHEHFGFQDGVSQPGIRGRTDQIFPHRMFLQASQNPDDPGQGLPGADLIWPGEFVFGYPVQDPSDPDNPGKPGKSGPDWMKNGSFMVFRRLNQLVPEFNAFIDDAGEKLAMDPDLVGARMVGRWKSGAPISIMPLQDDPVFGEDKLHNNDFDFDNDALGRRCPFAAHIRKAYPRNDITPAGQGASTEFEKRDLSEANTETHRILRRGIPFGQDVTEDEKKAEKTSVERGLLFVCYQTSIEDQFEFIIQNWVNNPGFAPLGNTPGFDPLLGQDAGHSPRPVEGLASSYPTGPRGPQTVLPIDFIIPSGGGYFFMPSIATLRQHIAS